MERKKWRGKIRNGERGGKEGKEAEELEKEAGDEDDDEEKEGEKENDVIVMAGYKDVLSNVYTYTLLFFTQTLPGESVRVPSTYSLAFRAGKRM